MPVFYSEGLDGRKQQKMPMQDPARVVVLAFAKFSGISSLWRCWHVVDPAHVFEFSRSPKSAVCGVSTDSYVAGLCNDF